MMRKAVRGFTLIEMLIVIAIISILAGILVPVIVSARQRGNRLNCAANLKQIGYALAKFSHEFDGIFPNEYWNWNYNGNDNSGQTLGMLYPDYVNELKLFQCPGSADPLPVAEVVNVAANTLNMQMFTNTCSYAYHRVMISADIDKVVIAADEDAIGTDYLVGAASPNHQGKGANVLWVKGAVTWEDAKNRAEGVAMTEGLYSTDKAVGSGSGAQPPIAEDHLGGADAGLNYAGGSTVSPHDVFLRMKK